MDWKLRLAQLEFEVLGIEAFPALAVEALIEGEDTPALRILAGLEGGYEYEIRKYLADFLKETGIKVPEREEAVLLVIRSILDEVIDRKIAPFAGMKRIFWDIVNAPHDPFWEWEEEESTRRAVFKKLITYYFSYWEILDNPDVEFVWEDPDHVTVPVTNNEEMMIAIEEMIYQEALIVRSNKIFVRD